MLSRYFVTFFLFTVFFISPSISAQQKMDLEDLSIKGEVHSDDRLRLLARENSKIKNFVKYRTDYRAEITEGLRVPKPRLKYYKMGEYTP